MSYPALLNEPCTVTNPTTTTADGYGDVRPAGPSSADTFGYLEQVTSDEHQVDRDTIVSDWICFLLPGTDVGPLSTVTFASQTFQVVGEPELKWNPRTGAVHHVECKLRVVKG